MGLIPWHGVVCVVIGGVIGVTGGSVGVGVNLPF